MKSGIFIISMLVFGLFIFGSVSGEDDFKSDDVKCLPCGDECAPYDMVTVAECLPPTIGEFKCGVEKGECFVLQSFNVDAGTTPDSIFYAFDKFFDTFKNDLDVREERVAEIKVMVEAGKYKDARHALKEYYQIAERLEKEVSYEDRERAVSSAAAIRGAIKEIESMIPEEENGDFSGIIEKENSISTAAEIASKINNLCRELSELSPNLFYENCRADDEGPEWHKEMFKDLTEEQEVEARNFANIMKQCFKTSGQDCRCEEIPYEDFSAACSAAAPLATACDIDGDEEACDKLDSLDMPDLPPHLQGIFDELDSMDEERYDMHMPKECEEAGATTPDECGRIMVEMHSPPECKEALLEANTKTEREGREICDAIMMKIHAPECAEEGIKDPEECKDFMWNMDRRPKECQDNQIHDFRDCKKFLSEGSQQRNGPGPRMDFNCKEISDPTERLACYDGATSQVGGWKDVKGPDYSGPCMTPEDWDAKKSECRSLYGENAGDEPVYGDSGEGYECVIDAECVSFGEFEIVEGPSEDWEDWGSGDYEENECSDGCDDECPGASSTSGCENNGNQCICHYDDDEESDGGDGESSEEEDNSGEGSDDSEDNSGEDEADDSGGDMITGNFFLNYWFN